MILLGFIGNLSGMDGLILFFIVLLLFGAKRLPELARGLGSAINEFNKAKDDVHKQITQTPVQPPPVPAAPAAPAAPEGQQPAAPAQPSQQAPQQQPPVA